MKKRFFIHIAVILLMSFTLCLAVIHEMWFCSIGAGMIMAISVFAMYRWTVNTRELLDSERIVQRKTEKSLGQAEAQLLYYKMLMEKVDTAVMLATESGHVEWMNPIAKEIVGESCLLQKSVVEAIDSNKEIVKLGGKEYALSHSLVTVSGSKRIIVAMKNIQSAMERTEVDSWHKLVRVLTHEIMNSITPIISLSETLCEMTNTNDSAEMLTQGLDVIHRRSQGLLNFVENYRKLTRVAMPDKTLIEVKGFFADLKKLYPQPFVTFDTGNNEDISIYADRGQMEQVMINLLKNAMEATASTAMPQIRCACKKDNADNAGKTIITVEDNGQGILPDVLERIFVPFFTTKKNGSGIGLSLCKQIIMNHGGEISIESEDGKGTSVTIRIDEVCRQQ